MPKASRYFNGGSVHANIVTFTEEEEVEQYSDGCSRKTRCLKNACVLFAFHTFYISYSFAELLFLGQLEERSILSHAVSGGQRVIQSKN